MLNVLSLKGK